MHKQDAAHSVRAVCKANRAYLVGGENYGRGSVCRVEIAFRYEQTKGRSAVTARGNLRVRKLPIMTAGIEPASRASKHALVDHLARRIGKGAEVGASSKVEVDQVRREHYTQHSYAGRNQPDVWNLYTQMMKHAQKRASVMQWRSFAKINF